MPPAKISSTSALTVSRSRLAFTSRRLHADPLTKDEAAPFDLQLEKWKVVFQMELDLIDQVEERAVECVVVDCELNKYAKVVSKTALTIVSDDASHSLYTHYFKGKPVHLFIKPLLGEQLESMRGWLPSLSTSEYPSLKALHAGLAELVLRADTALKAKATAKQALADFRDIGERKAFLCEVNALLKETWGTLSTLPHKHVGLPSSFADTFFRRDRGRGKRDGEPTVESVKLEIGDLQEQLAAKERELEDLSLDKAKAAAKVEAEARTAAQKKLEQAEKDLEAKAKEIALLKAKLEFAPAPAPHEG